RRRPGLFHRERCRMIRNWCKGLARNYRSLSQRGRTSRRWRYAALAVEALEERTVPTAQPVDLIDPSLFGVSGLKDSSHASLSADGQLLVFQSNSDNLVPNDTNC